MSDKPTFTIYQGDAARMPIADAFVDLTVTSPPYEDVRAYHGFVFDFEATAQELSRVTKSGGVVVWVVADKYRNHSDSLESFSQALFFKSLGFCVRPIIFAKKQVPPFNHKTQSFYPPTHEYMFVMSKGKPKTFNPICDRENKYQGKFEPTLSKKRDRNGIACSHEKNWTVPEKSLRTTIWEYNVGRHHSTNDTEAFGHPAIFPERLAKDCILSWSNAGDTVLDCFTGSGTTGKMAVAYKRNFIGIEISKEYCEIAEARIRRALGEGVSLPQRETTAGKEMPLFEGNLFS